MSKRCVQVYERQNKIFVVCQDFNDIAESSRGKFFHEFRFCDENASLFRNFINSKAVKSGYFNYRHDDCFSLNDAASWLYKHSSQIQSCIDCGRLAEDCSSGIKFSLSICCGIWSRPENKEEEVPFVEYLVSRGYRLPENYKPHTVYRSSGYWPLILNTAERRAVEILGITPCAAYVTCHQIIPFRDLRLFYL